MIIDTPKPAEPRLFTRNFVLVCLASTANGSSFQLLLATLPLYVLDMGGHETEVGLLFSLLSLAALASRPLAAWAVEAFGRKPLMLAGSGFYVTASLAYSFIGSIPMLLLLRAYHGLGIGAYSTGSMVFVADQAPPRRRGEAMGYYGMSHNLSQAAGPALGLVILEVMGFRGLFLWVLALSVVALAMTIALKDNFVPVRQAPFKPSMVFTPKVLRPLPLILAQSLAMAALMSFVSLYGRQQGVENPGIFFTVYAVATIISRPTFGALSDRVGRMATIAPGMVVMASGLGLLAVSGQFWYLVVAAVLTGVGSGTVFPALMALVLDLAGTEERGAAVSSFTVGMDLGFGVGSGALGVIIQMAGFPVAFVIAATGLLSMLALYGAISLIGSKRGSADRHLYHKPTEDRRG